MIVCDLGCQTHGEDASLEPLIARFSPEVVYGFDPFPGFEGVETIDGCQVVVSRRAAWITNGTLDYVAWALNSTVMPDKNLRGEWTHQVSQVECFDFSEWLQTMPPMVVKMDIEGAEFPILEKMVNDGTDLNVTLLLVEWHDHQMGWGPEKRTSLLERLRCPVEAWA